ncbi:MAG: trigger factor [Anaerolineales bacterium]|nr:trigger factor [Anaerolineales bacterium]MCX7756602.1 trigger factor [Anaerolineales bacterium]MDW8277860.1 trigger factor [Anaerolineales bacterium]
MKIETHPRDDHQMTMVVELETEQMESARRKAARRIAEKVNIPGFRRGKAPYEVVRRLYGDGVLNEEAIELLVDEIYPKALSQAGLKPAAAGSLENIESLEPPKFVFNVPLAPTVELGDYKSIRLPYEWVAPDESKVEQEIEQLRQIYATSQTVERPAQETDYVLVAVTGRKAGAPEGEDAVLLERSAYAVVMRTEPKDGEWPFPGFSTHLLGARPGDVVEFTHTYPEDFDDETLRGQSVQFSVTVKSIRGVTLPELNDEFAQKTGLGATVEELRQKMRENVNLESQNEYDDRYFENLFEQIQAGATIKYPPQVLEHEIEHVLEDVDRRLRAQGIGGLEKYLEITGSTREQFIEEKARPTAKKRLERGLLMDELARVENIEVDQKSLEEEFGYLWIALANTDEEFARRTKGGTKPTREIVDAVAMDSINRVMTRRVLERLKTIATGQADTAANTTSTADTPSEEAQDA